MKVIAPWNPINLEWSKEDQSKTLSMVVDGELWNWVWDDEPEKLLLKKSGSWQDAFKGSIKLVEEWDEKGWTMDADGLTMPLFVQEGSSDKEYHINFNATPGGWETVCLYGRRGSTLKTADKAKNASLKDAWKEFRDVAAQKIKDGYQLYIAGVVYQAGARFEKVNELAVSLLTEATDVETLIESDAFWMQEKFDGERRPVIKTSSGEFIGTNKNAMSVNLNRQFEEALSKVNASSFKLDAEDLGGKLAIFDITEINGESLISHSFEDRQAKLKSLLEGVDSDVLMLARVYKTEEEKRSAMAELIARRAEGVVFSEKGSTYTNGKNLAGTRQKFKFYAEATVKVTQINQKRSVGVSVWRPDEKDAKKDVWVDVGNVTIPANANIPQVNDFIEVRYLYAYPQGCLFLPTYKSERKDQTKEGCHQNKLKFKADYDYAQEVCSRLVQGKKIKM